MWIDLVDPDHKELLGLANKFNLDPDALETYFNKSKKPEIRLLDNQIFTVILDCHRRLSSGLLRKHIRKIGNVNHNS